MSNAFKQLLEFGPFQVDPEQRLLLRDRQSIPLSPKAFDLLLALLQRSGQVVLKDDLMKLLWPDTFVEESNLGQHVFQLRKALGERAQDHSYIVTIPGRGYRFVQQVRLLPASSATSTLATEEIVVQSHTRSRMVVEEDTLPARPSPQTYVHPTARRRFYPAILLIAVIVLVVVGYLFRPAVPAPTVVRIRQLTHLGTLVYNTKLLTDGPRIYFRVWQGRERVIRYVSPDGGEVSSVAPPFANVDLDDISPNGSEFLALELGDPLVSGSQPHPLWRVATSDGSPRQLGDARAMDSRWSPDGNTIVCTDESSLSLVYGDGSNRRTLASFPSQPFYPQWSRDGLSLRFSLADEHRRGQALWQIDLAGHLRRLLRDWPVSTRPHAGEWTPDGRYFFFTAISDGARDIWAMRETGEHLRRVNLQPVRLSAGPINFSYPTPSRDGKSIFAIGVQERGQLLRYDLSSRQFAPYAQGASLDHVTFSRDGEWMAYVEYPQGVLVRSRVDGSDRRQLTFPPMRVLHPQWSPNGKQLAFQASADLGAARKIYLISKDGGVPALATPAPDYRQDYRQNDLQDYPSWSAKGDAILFSASDETDANQALYTVDLKSKQVAQLPGTAGLNWGALSPDGGHIAAITDSPQKLVLYDMATHATQTVAALGDYPAWSADGQFIYFSTLYFRKPDAGVYRYQLSSGRTEQIMAMPDFLIGGFWGSWFGLTPKGEPLVVRDLSSTDLYAFDLDLP